MAAPIRIVGIGSPHGGDRAGWEYVEALQHCRLQDRFPAGMISIHQSPTPVHLFELLAGCQHAIIIDAIPGTVGQITCLDIADLENQADHYSVHGIGVVEALDLLNTLMDPAPQSTILAIGIDPAQGEASDTEIHQATVSRLAELIEQRIWHSSNRSRVTGVS
jgi:hydrogenase maturation protease